MMNMIWAENFSDGNLQRQFPVGVLGIQPFDQPNVESAKVEAKAMIK
ncbi:MAG: hypothetical protein IPO41_13080 [Acidobacteria bacterium]|nr:hypothetical protein [Acidobacteriota bacterium]